MTLEEAAKKCEELHAEFLFGHDDWINTGMDSIAEQELCIAIEQVRLAQRHFMIAHLHQVRALAADPRSRW